MDDDCGGTPFQSKQPDEQPVIRKDLIQDKPTGPEKVVVYEGPGVQIITERGTEYMIHNDKDGWHFPVTVPNVLLDKQYTREQIKEIFFQHQTHALARPFIGHPDVDDFFAKDEREAFKVLLERTENLFLEVDQKHFDHILVGLKRKMPNLDFAWKFGVLFVNGGKTKIKAAKIDRAWKNLRELGKTEDIEDFIITLIVNQLGEIFFA